MLQVIQAKETIYGAINQPVLSRVPATSKRVLDLGCGSGALGRQLKQNIACECEVLGVTYSDAEAAIASQ